MHARSKTETETETGTHLGAFLLSLPAGLQELRLLVFRHGCVDRWIFSERSTTQEIGPGSGPLTLESRQITPQDAPWRRVEVTGAVQRRRVISDGRHNAAERQTKE